MHLFIMPIFYQETLVQFLTRHLRLIKLYIQTHLLSDGFENL
jgi:hypothetical protein